VAERRELAPEPDALGPVEAAPPVARTYLDDLAEGTLPDGPDPDRCDKRLIPGERRFCSDECRRAAESDHA
jgi:hypothetical protein